MTRQNLDQLGYDREFFSHLAKLAENQMLELTGSLQEDLKWGRLNDFLDTNGKIKVDALLGGSLLEMGYTFDTCKYQYKNNLKRPNPRIREFLRKQMDRYPEAQSLKILHDFASLDEIHFVRKCARNYVSPDGSLKSIGVEVDWTVSNQASFAGTLKAGSDSSERLFRNYFEEKDEAITMNCISVESPTGVYKGLLGLCVPPRDPAYWDSLTKMPNFGKK